MESHRSSRRDALAATTQSGQRGIKILVRCREEVERGLVVREPYVLISVRDPGKRPVQVGRTPMCRAVLSLKVHDAEPTKNLKLPPGIRLMTEGDAQAIWTFVCEHAHDVRTIVVHCEQGMSRSPAIAAGLATGLGGDAGVFARRYQPNAFVVSLMLKVMKGRDDV
jgi:predicted protein tyrosine phosphatase